MAKTLDQLAEAKRIAARMLATPPEPHQAKAKAKAKAKPKARKSPNPKSGKPAK